MTSQGGFGLEIKIDITGTATAIVGVLDGEIPEFEKFLAEMTPHNAAGGYAVHVATGKRKMNEFKLTLGWDADEVTHAAVLAAFDGSPAVDMAVIALSGHIFKLGRISPQEDGYKCDVTIQPSGAPTMVTKYTFTGVAAAGPCTLTGASVGDIVVHGYRSSGVAYAGEFSTDFETVITVANQIQQIAVGDLSGTTFAVKLVPAGTI